MVIGFITEMVHKDLGEKAFLGVAIIALGNSVGRIISGYFSDKIGRIKTLLIFFLFQSYFYLAYFTYGGNNSVLIIFLGYIYWLQLRLEFVCVPCNNKRCMGDEEIRW